MISINKTTEKEKSLGIRRVCLRLDEGEELSDRHSWAPAELKVTNGRISLRIDSGELVVEAGSTISLPPNIPHSLVALQSSEAEVLVFQGQ